MTSYESMISCFEGRINKNPDEELSLDDEDEPSFEDTPDD